MRKFRDGKGKIICGAAAAVLAGLLALPAGGCTREWSAMGDLARQIAAPARSTGLQVVKKSDLAMDTVVQLTATGPEAEAAVEEGLGRVHELERLLDPKLEGSDARRLEEAAGTGAWVRVSPEMLRLLTLSRRISILSEGAWDITAGPLTRLWGIGTEAARVPGEEELAGARALVDYRLLEIDEENSSARLMKKGMCLEVGGIAKGLAADEVRAIYKAHGVEHGLINLGSSTLYAMGENSKGQLWHIGMKNPRGGEGGKPLTVVELSGEALSSSGDYERFFEEGGRRYHHILDPRTGKPAGLGLEPALSLMSVLVVVPGSEPEAAMLSDALATTAFILGPEQGRAFLEGLSAGGIEGAEGILVSGDKVLHTTPLFRERLRRLSDESYRFAGE